jgi:DNA (cytosine-5)-methyltransferase 3A
LFFVFVDIWQHIQNHNPKAHFLLENVRMKQEHEAVITSYMKVHPITINSALVSAQNRVRLYWTNIANEPYGFFGDMRCTIEQPKDQGILLRDVLEDDVDEKYYLSEKAVKGFIKQTEKHQERGNGFKFEPTTGNCKGASLTTKAGSRIDDNYIVAQRGRNPENPKSRKAGLHTEQMLEPRMDGKTNCITTVQKDNLVITHSTQPRMGKGQGGKGHLFKTDQKSYCLDTGNSQAVELTNKVIQLNERQQRNYKELDQKTNSLLASCHKGSQANGMTLIKTQRIRRLTPLECQRLQTVPEWYNMSVISDTQRYRCLGNGWTVNVIVWILSHARF